MDEKILNYIVYSLEEYKMKNRITGYEAAKYFRDKNIYSFVINNYGALHTQSSENLLLDIDEYVSEKN